MKDEPLEFVRGSGNVFRDLDVPNPELHQLRAILAARIIRILQDTGMSVRAAHEATGTPAADFSRIRRAKLDGFTVDRLMDILYRLDQEFEISVDVHPRLDRSVTVA